MSNGTEVSYLQKIPRDKILESRKKKGRAEKATSTSDATILLLRLHHIKRSEQRLPLKRPLMKASEVFGERKRMTLLQFVKQGIFKRSIENIPKVVGFLNEDKIWRTLVVYQTMKLETSPFNALKLVP
ncbi:hypothetical protein CDAR_604791 [Caerostris darwini]|uniref:Uncharacterized protein n=1 Tax=Caerostris darwini TaxID=1538125 RepID=A0AAV4VS67_9ARAC|nr:hypothetical protein CDAR_604791 [Caerostris darwini]